MFTLDVHYFKRRQGMEAKSQNWPVYGEEKNYDFVCSILA